MAESFRVENAAMAADRGLGDQGIEPAELLPDRQLVGIEDQVASDPTSSTPAGAAKSSLICRSRRGGSGIPRAIERNQAQRLVSMNTRISSVLVLAPASRLPGWHCDFRKLPHPIDREPICGGCGPPLSGFVDGKGEIG